MAADAATVAPLKASASADPIDGDTDGDFEGAAADGVVLETDDAAALAEGSAGHACSSEAGDNAGGVAAVEVDAAFAAELAEAEATLNGGA